MPYPEGTKALTVSLPEGLGREFDGAPAWAVALLLEVRQVRTLLAARHDAAATGRGARDWTERSAVQELARLIGRDWFTAKEAWLRAHADPTLLASLTAADVDGPRALSLIVGNFAGRMVLEGVWLERGVKGALGVRWRFVTRVTRSDERVTRRPA